MTEAQYNLFLSAGAWLCALGAVFNLFLLKRRGNSAFLMSGSFVAMGAVLWMIKSHANQVLITGAGLLVGGLLIADLVLRAKTQGRPR